MARMYPSARLAASILVVCLCARHVTEAHPGNFRSLLQGNSVSASSRTRQSDAGRSTAVATASSEVIEEAQSEIATAVSSSLARVANNQGTALAEALASAKAVATGYVKVVVSAGVEVSGTSTGSDACGSAQASGEGEATATAEAVARGLAQANVGVTEAQADGVAEAVRTASLQVFASAFAEACVTQGDAIAFQRVEAEGYICVVAEALVALYATVEGEDAAADSFSLADVSECQNATVTTESISTVDGQGTALAEGAGDVITPCQFPESSCCTRAKKLLGSCSCGRGCVVTKDRSMSTRTVAVWMRRDSGLTCTC